MNNTYLAGSLVRVATYAGSLSDPVGGFRNADGILADPTAVTLKYRPGKQATVVTVVYPAVPIIRDDTGLYHADLDTTGAATDTWTYEWVGTGAVQAIAERTFQVQAAPLLCATMPLTPGRCAMPPGCCRPGRGARRSCCGSSSGACSALPAGSRHADVVLAPVPPRARQAVALPVRRHRPVLVRAQPEVARGDRGQLPDHRAG
jgi:hypothetical protein